MFMISNSFLNHFQNGTNLPVHQALLVFKYFPDVFSVLLASQHLSKSLLNVACLPQNIIVVKTSIQHSSSLAKNANGRSQTFWLLQYKLKEFQPNACHGLFNMISKSVRHNILHSVRGI